MILTVTVNFAVDVTYHVEHFKRGETARISHVGRRAGGKGVNVARVLHALGRDVVVTGLAGGFTGELARAELGRAGIRAELAPMQADSRLTFMVVEADGQATGFSENGPEVSESEWRGFVSRYRELAQEAEAVVISGSFPPSLPPDGYRQLVAAAPVPVLLDADGEPLERALDARPEIVKINAAELAGVRPQRDLVAGAASLREAGGQAVVVSEGPAGMTCVTDDEILHAAPPEPLSGNPTGAGDAASASLIAGLLDGYPWDVRLADATALSAAAVCTPLAGSFDAAIYERLRGQIRARRVSLD